MPRRMNLLQSVDGDEVSPVERAANRRRFALLKEDSMSLDAEVADILEVPWEHEGKMLDELRKQGADETVQKAAVSAIRLLKGIEEDLPWGMREAIEKLGTEMYPTVNPKLNETAAKAMDVEGDCAEPDEDDMSKRDVSAEERKDLASEGKAMSGGSFPIKDEGDLKNAITAYGRAKDKGKAKTFITGRAKSLGLTNLLPDAWKVSKEADEPEPELPDEPEAEEDVNVEKGGTVADETHAVPVKKEDGTWDLSGVSEADRPFYTEILKSNETLAEQNVTLRKELGETKSDLSTKEYVEKAGKAYDKIAPAAELGPILKEAADKLEPETFEKLEGILAGAAERVASGDLFKEAGKASGLPDGSSTDAYSKILAKADELVEKDGDMTREQATDRVLKAHPELYSDYLVQAAGGVS